MVIRTVAVVGIALAALLTGCGSDAAPAASDEEQIRELLDEAIEATNSWDGAKMAELSCAKYRDRAATFKDVVPPMSTFPRDVVESMGPDVFAQNLGEQFTGASPESVRAVTDAVMNSDESAYTTAMKDVMKQSMTIGLEKVDNIVITGDTATADLTMTATVGAQPPETQSDKVDLVREDGVWKDCTAAPSGTT
jgi:hypothetical protein